MDAVPFTPLTAEFLDDMIENIESLSDGTGFENGAITTNALADNAVTSAKLSINGAGVATVAANQSTSSASYTDLATVGPSVTVTVGPSGMVMFAISSLITVSAAQGLGYISIAASGANTITASDTNYYVFQSSSSSGNLSASVTKILSGLNAGTTTFTLKYKSLNSSVSFLNRTLSVIPL